MQNLRFSVIIPVFNKWELTEACLKSLRSHTLGEEFEVIAVDNASGDATCTELNPLGVSLFGARFKSIRHETNRNFAAACNAGAKLAGAPLCFFLNNDTLLTENWAPPLEEALQNNPALGAVGPLLLYPDNTVQHLGIVFSTKGIAHLYSGFPATHPLVAKTRYFQAITAAALLVRRELFFEAGAFYEEYRNGFEDVELCLRLCKLGTKFTCVPQSRIIHLESQSAGRNDGAKHNSDLLTARCSELFFPDYHLHGLRDGLKAVYDDSLGQSLLLADKDDLALRKKVTAEGASDQKEYINSLYRNVRENPLWLWGNETLAKELEKTKAFAEASAYYIQAFNIYCSLDGAKNLLKIATITANTELMEAADKYLAKIIALKRDAVVYTTILKRNIDTANRFNDSFLLRLSEEKLSELRK